MWTTFNIIVYCLLFQFFGENNGLMQSGDLLLSKDRRLKGLRQMGNKLDYTRNTMDLAKFSDVQNMPEQKKYFAAILLENLPKLIDPVYEERIPQNRDIYSGFVDNNDENIDGTLNEFSNSNQHLIEEGISHFSNKNSNSKAIDHGRLKRYRSAVSDRIAHGFGKRDYENFRKSMNDMERDDVIITLKNMIKQLTYKGDFQTLSKYLRSMDSISGSVDDEMKQRYNDDETGDYSSYPLTGILNNNSA